MTQNSLQTVDAVRQDLQRLVRPLRDVEIVALPHACGRVLAKEVIATLQVPPHDNSAMDGYALRVADSDLLLPVSQRIPAGSMPQPLQTGTAARIFTGAPIPPGADVVIEQESVTVDEQGQIRVQRPLQAGQHIRKAGEDINLGQRIIPVGQTLNAADLGLTASQGIAQLSVLRRPRVAVFFTGDELTEPGQPLPAGKIYNSNRYWLVAKLQGMGCQVHDLGIVPDSLAATCQALRDAAQEADVVITCGGVSVGEEDHIKAAVQQEGELTMWKIAMKPGKPLAYGRLGNSDFIGLPGNPVSGFVVFEVLIRAFLLARSGVTMSWQLPMMQLPAAFDWCKADPRREEYLRVRRELIDGVWQLQRYANQGSGVLTSCAWAEGLVRLQPDQTVKPGDLLEFIPLAH